MVKPGAYAAIGLVLAALTGVGTAVYLHSGSTPPPAQHDEIPPPPPSNPDRLPEVAFAPDAGKYTLIRQAAAYVAPSHDAPPIYVLPAGTSLIAAAKSRDGNWVIAMTENGVPANIQTADLGPYAPRQAPKDDAVIPVPGADIAGDAQVIDSATLLIGGQHVALWGVIGRPGDPADRLKARLRERGTQVSCTPAGLSYLCRYSNGNDIARDELFNGTVEASPDASADYQNLAMHAKEQHKGIWN